MDPKERKETQIKLVDEKQEFEIPSEQIQCMENDKKEYYDTPVDFDGFYQKRFIKKN